MFRQRNLWYKYNGIDLYITNELRLGQCINITKYETINKCKYDSIYKTRPDLLLRTIFKRFKYNNQTVTR